MKLVHKVLAPASLLVCVAVAYGAFAQTGTTTGTTGATTAPATCKAQATGKKLAGAALTSFMTKCEKDATAACDKTAADKKLAGAAKTSFTKKCVSDATGS
ncbi:MAG: hypothetical protein JSR91_04690 [Proteobacteria bacterium]|nr:hypothetical protein [Pseudomonadota bacterium]